MLRTFNDAIEALRSLRAEFGDLGGRLTEIIECLEIQDDCDRLTYGR